MQELQKQIRVLEDERRALASAELLKLLQEGSWILQDESLCARDQATSARCRAIAVACGVTWHHEDFYIYLGEQEVAARIDDGVVRFDINTMTKFEGIDALGLGPIIDEQIAEEQRNIERYQRNIVEHQAQLTKLEALRGTTTAVLAD